MNPKILTTPSHRLSTEASGLYHAPENSDNREQFESEFSKPLTHVQNPSRSTEHMLEVAARKLNNKLEFHHSELEKWHSFVDQLGDDVYAEAYEKTIVNDELASRNETIALINDVLDTYNQDELADGPTELETVADRLETLSSWPDDSEPYELQIHRYVTNAVWSAWAAEQTPTAIETASA